jgi:hypothetical protein
MMIDVAKALWHKPQVSRLTPYEQIKAHIEKLPLLYFLLNSWQP